MQKSGALPTKVTTSARVGAAVPSTSEINALVTLFRVGHYDELERRAHALLARYPTAGGVWKLIAGARFMLGKNALPEFERAASLLPDDAETHFNYAVALKNAGRLPQAAQSNRRALALKGNYFEAHNNLGTVYRDLGQLDDAIASYQRALELNPKDLIARANLLTCQHYTGSDDVADRFAASQKYGALVASIARPYTTWDNTPDPTRRLRVGLVSGDLREHAVGFFLEGVLQAMVRNASAAFEFVAYSNNADSDALTERLKACCVEWRMVVGVSDEKFAAQIRDDKIDILIDLAGHTMYNRVPMFAWKPAPVQVTWLGYFATTGVAAIDYLIADVWTLPPSEERYFSEKIWRLPETRLCFTPPNVAVEVAPLPALEHGFVTFGCFNNLGKINNQTVALWSRVLHAVPDSRLFLKTRQLGEAIARQRILERFAAQGIDASRLLLEGSEAIEKYFSAYHRVDIALDPFPYPGGVITVHSLWMGVPVLTRVGENFLARQGVGLLMNAGLSEWVAADDDEYVARACQQVSDLPRLAQLRAGLRNQVLTSPVFDAQRFARHFAVALRAMWEKWCQR